VNFEPVIGCEIHVHLKTATKMFCRCPTGFGDPENTRTCPVCLAHPGALPVPNERAIEWTIKLGLALGCEIARHTKWDRKSYFYPDLPKNYQISQYEHPIVGKGEIEIESFSWGATNNASAAHSGGGGGAGVADLSGDAGPAELRRDDVRGHVGAALRPRGGVGERRHQRYQALRPVGHGARAGVVGDRAQARGHRLDSLLGAPRHRASPPGVYRGNHSMALVYQ